MISQIKKPKQGINSNIIKKGAKPAKPVVAAAAARGGGGRRK
jgi:hypothetical protein